MTEKEKFKDLIEFAKMVHGWHPVAPPDEVVKEVIGDAERQGYQAMMRNLQKNIIDTVDKLEKLSALVIVLNPEQAKSLGKPDGVE